MKTVRMLLGSLILVLGLAVAAQATLIDRGNGLIYDSDLNITWLQNVNLGSQKTFGVSGIEASGQMGWWAAQSWIAAMNAANYLGYSSWRLPVANPVNGSSYNYSYQYDGSTDLGYNISALGSAYPENKNNELAYMFYINLGNNGAYDISGKPEAAYGVKNQGYFINLANLPAPGAVTPYVIFWCGPTYGGPPNYPGETDEWSFRYDYGYQFHYALDHTFYIWPVLSGDPAYPRTNTPPPAIDHLVLAINAGGTQYTGQTGALYVTDSYFAGGQTYSTVSAITVPPSDSAPAVDMTAYQSIRYGDFSYNLPLANGNYNVTLKFAEIYWNAAGERVFNVSMQGQTVISSLDIVAKVGKNAAYDVTIPVSVTNGMLNINFASIVDNACVSAIVVQSASYVGAPPVINLNPTSLSFTAVQGTNPVSQTIAVSNLGGGTLNLSAVADTTAPEWLSVVQGSGTLTASVNSASLAPGQYSKTITVSAPGATNTPQTVNVALTVNSQGTNAVVFADHAGGGQYTDQSGVVYQADTDYSGGVTWSTGAAIAGTADSALYQSVRYGNFSYNIAVANGNYTVTLKLAELYWTAAGQRVFNVSMQGQTVLSKLDIFAHVGKNAAYDVAVPVTVTNGMLNIQFTSVADNACVSAIVVQNQSYVGAPPVIQLNPTSLSFTTLQGTSPSSQQIAVSNVGGGTLNWSATAGTTVPEWLSVVQGSGIVTASVNSATLSPGQYSNNISISATGATNTPQTVNVNLSVMPKGTVFADHAGGGQYTDQSGVVYQADTDYSGGVTWSTGAAIAGTADSALYQSVRYGNFSYNIPLANGNYTVTLKLAELYWTAAGQRVFNVSMQGQTVLSKLDIFAHVGKNAAYDVSIPVTVTNGMLNINFASVLDYACVSAIEITLN